MRAQAMLQIAKSALAMDTPLALHFLSIFFVISSSNGTVGTTVCRLFPDCRGKDWPPYRNKARHI